MGKKCIACGNINKPLFEFPNAVPLRTKWLEAMERFYDVSMVTDYSVLCKNHFHESNLKNYKHKIGLAKEAVPSIFSFTKQSEVDYQECIVENDFKEIKDNSREIQVKRNEYVSKWNVLFDRIMSQWISFKPQEGLNVYPCYACRDMFGSRRSFLDHVNRRGILLTYKCRDCSQDNPLLFYNPCSFLLHARLHCNMLGGQIDLDDLSIHSLPFGLAGFLPHPDVPLIFEADDELVGNCNLNTRFYSPVQQDQGKRIIHLLPTILLFYYTATTETRSVTLVLKQTGCTVPCCKFVVLENHTISSLNDGHDLKRKEEVNEANVLDDKQTKQQPPSEHNLPKVSDAAVQQTTQDQRADNEIVNTASCTKKLESNFNCCPECKQVQSSTMAVHFINANKPLDEKIKCTVCKFVAPTECSLRAHLRIHVGAPPFVCPECGKDFFDCEILLDHLDDVCFHLAKQVRYRCPKKNCYKVFAQYSTFNAHFAVHVQTLTRCRMCNTYFYSLKEYLEHANTTHENVVASEQIRRCAVCKNGPPLNDDELYAHLKWHCANRTNCIYVYACKYCRNFFRSTLTYASHLLRCSKKVSTLGDDPSKFKKSHTTTICSNCNYIIRIVTTISHCPKCGQPFHTPFTLKRINEKHDDDDNDSDAESTCLLCQKEMTLNEYLDHVKGNKCRYSQPIVPLNRVSSNIPTPEEVSPKKKRKKDQMTPAPPTSPSKNAKPHIAPSRSDRLQLEAPMPFNGTYRCRFCSKEFKSRAEFHDHIVKHRDVSTAYQCMECGECFVVKPSLQKHLFYYHQVIDFEEYVKDNECFDRNAVSELREIMYLAPGESKRPVAENQCRVCLRQFKDEFELNKHFRMHGMAFLLKNSK